MTIILDNAPFVLSEVEVRAQNALACRMSLDFARDERGNETVGVGA